MTLAKADRERVEELVAALEDAGADVEKVQSTRYDREAVIEFKFSGEIDA